MDINESAPQCSICLEAVVDNNLRSTARLRCAHVFHLDCIGSEFNIKGVMQCPNCRVTEDGQWLFGAGGFQQSINNEDIEEDIDDDTYIEMNPAELHWCMLNGFSSFPFLYGERMATQTGSGPNFPYPWHPQPMATGFPQPVSIPGIPLQPPSWVPQAPFTPVGNTLNPGYSAQPLILGHSGSQMEGPYPAVASSSPAIRFRVHNQQPYSNSPSPVVRASMLARMRRSNNPVAVNSVRPVPSSSDRAGGGYDRGMLQEPASEAMPVEIESDESSYTMYQFL